MSRRKQKALLLKIKEAEEQKQMLVELRADELHRNDEWTIEVFLKPSGSSTFGKGGRGIVVKAHLTMDCLVVQYVPDDAVSVSDRVEEIGYPLHRVDAWFESGKYVNPYSYVSSGRMPGW